MLLRLLVLLSVLLTVSGCANKNLQTYVDNYSGYSERIFVIDHGMHTALVVEAYPLMQKLGMGDSFFSDYRFLEIGRGDAGFYQQREKKFSTTLKALFLTTPAILHVSAYNQTPALRFPRSETVELRLSSNAYDKLLSSIANAFERSDGKAVVQAEGDNDTSRYFKAVGNYHMFYTCNNWSADMLQQADLPIGHRWAFFSGSVMRQLGRIQKQLDLQCGTSNVGACKMSGTLPQ